MKNYFIIGLQRNINRICNYQTTNISHKKMAAKINQIFLLILIDNAQKYPQQFLIIFHNLLLQTICLMNCLIQKNKKNKRREKNKKIFYQVTLTVIQLTYQ